MPRRFDQSELSTERLNTVVTPTVYDRVKGLAWYLRHDEARDGYGRMLCRFAEEKRSALVAEGKRPPLRPPADVDWSSLGGARRGARPVGDTSERATKRLLLNVTPSERDRIAGLAYYCGWSISELLRRLEDEKRQELYAAGKRPPLKPPETEQDSRGPK